MKVALLAGDKNGADQGSTRALEDLGGQRLIDVQIAGLQKLGLEVMAILNYGDCEDILRSSKLLSECELIFDPNEDSGFFSQLSAACYGSEERFFALPLHTPVPAKPTWLRMEHHFYKKAHESSCALFQPFCPQRGELIAGFPLLITRKGLKLFRDERNFTSLTDERITVSRVPILSQDIIALFPAPHSPLRDLA
ncbi:MAG: hypothetical protein H6624_18605 [Bdellovibrionaceae bacterium]|nr:hypothetical protein [Bdellovibrionales bacterium]MCB9086357.1 hypothetical protein [Pseudobdellovibrionaceae bacterium]